MSHKHLFKDKIVIDVGCGTGILSIFAAKAGAKKVYAVEYAGISDYAEKIVKQNSLDDVITIIHSKIEEAKINEKVDIIISEWMGYFLLYEAMFDSVIFARDTWLKSDGIILPDKASLYIAGFEDIQYFDYHFDFWKNVYSIDMSIIRNESLKNAEIGLIEKKRIFTTTMRIAEFDLKNLKKTDLNFSHKYSIQALKDNSLSGFVGWFEVSFFSNLQSKVLLSTSPYLPETHWKQCLLYFDEKIQLNKGDYLNGTFAVRKNMEYFRELKIKISLRNNETNKIKEFFLR